MKRRVIVAVDDLFFAAKIRTTAEHLEVEVIFPRSLAALGESASEVGLSLIIVDLHLQRYDPFLIPGRLKNDEELSAAPLIGFFSHVQTELQRRAEAAGYDRVLPRSAFTKYLPDILLGNDKR